MKVYVDLTQFDDEEYRVALYAAQEAFERLLLDMGESPEIAREKAECMVESLDEEWKIMEGIRNN